MKCKKCGNKLKRNEEFCTYCGYYNGEDIDIEKDDEEEFDLISFEENSKFDKVKDNNEDSSINDSMSESFMEAYIGEDYKTIRKGFFNIYAFILNWIYFLYRKLYITGIIGLGITYFVIVYYLKYFVWYLLGSAILIGFLFNPYYKFIIKNRINRLRSKHEDMDSFEFTSLCAKVGGVNGIYTFLIFVVFLILVCLNFVSINLNRNHNTKFWEENTDREATCVSLLSVAYQDVVETFGYNNLDEGSCRIVMNPRKVYDAYLKMSSGDRIFYVYYLGVDGNIEYKYDTFYQNDLELKKANNSITLEEEELLRKYQNTVNTNYDIRKSEKEEKKLISENKDSEARNNFVISSDRIKRK